MYFTVSEFCLSFGIYDEGIYLLLIRFSIFFHRILVFNLMVNVYNWNYFLWFQARKHVIVERDRKSQGVRIVYAIRVWGCSQKNPMLTWCISFCRVNNDKIVRFEFQGKIVGSINPNKIVFQMFTLSN